MKKILAAVFTIISIFLLQLFYINFRLEQRINRISAAQELTVYELEKAEGELISSAVKLADLKMRKMKKNSDKPDMLIAAND